MEAHPRVSRILVADDHANLAESLAALLQQYGHPLEVQVAVDGRQAVRMARYMHPDVVLIELELPGMSGQEAASVIRRVLGQTVRLIAMSWNEVALQAACKGQVLFDDGLPKPISVHKLLQAARVGTNADK